MNHKFKMMMERNLTPIILSLFYLISLFLPYMRENDATSTCYIDFAYVFGPFPPDFISKWTYYYPSIAFALFIALLVLYFNLRRKVPMLKVAIAIFEAILAVVIATFILQRVNNVNSVLFLFTKLFGFGYYLSTLFSILIVAWLFRDLYITRKDSLFLNRSTQTETNHDA